MRVLLANDSSPYSQTAAEYLVSMPFRQPIDLDLVAAVLPPTVPDNSLVGMPMDLGTFIKEECDGTKKRLENAAKQLAGSGHSVHTHVPVGLPSTELLQMAERTGADLVVMGAVGHSALRRVLLGSVSDYVATHCDVSTLVVRPPSQPGMSPKLKRIVLALSGSAEDDRMVKWLEQLEFGPDVEVHLVRVIQLHRAYQHDIREGAPDFWRSYVEEAQQRTAELDQAVRAMGVTTKTHLPQRDHAGETIVEYAQDQDCDLILTGDRDYGLLTRLIIGSTSRYVLRHAQCSVLIVREPKDQQAETEQAEGQSQLQAVDS
ncbi:MAG: universal stress protein [Pirellulales bacterium]|nr:universal stress protein [Pirellulales bacterium]